MRRILGVLSAAVLAAVVLAVGASAESLSDVLARMDRAAAEFKTFTAKVKQTEFTAILDETTTKDGVVRLKRSGSVTVARMEFLEPDPSVMHISGRTIQVFYPKANTVQIYDAGKNANMVAQFLVLGFGTSQKELQKSYDIKLGGADRVGNVSATRLELTPKAKEIKEVAARIDLWIPDGQGSPIQERVTKPSKDYSLYTYSEPRLNAALPDADFTLTLPAGVKKIYPQK